MTQATSQVATIQSFQEQIAERIRASIGELMPAEVLAEMVNRAMEDAFFKPRYAKEGYGYNEKLVEKPPFLADLIKEVMQKQVADELQKWMSENSEQIQQTIKEFVEKGAGEIVLSAITDKFAPALQMMRMNLDTVMANR